MRIISGGQTGADQGGLEAGRDLGLETGGWAPKGWLTETGPQHKLLEGFGLSMCKVPGYPARTLQNVLEADLTVIFGRGGGGSSLTMRYCMLYGKPYLVNPSAEELCALIGLHDAKILNVAGNRESRNPGIQRHVREFLKEALSRYNKITDCD